MTFDVRTRTAEDITGVDVATFHREIVPGQLRRHGEVASRAMQVSGLESIVIAVDGDAYTWRLDSDGVIEVVEGDHGRARADLPAEWFADVVDDVRSTVALMIADVPVMTRGGIFHLIAWEPILRALTDGRPANEPGLVDFVDRDGTPLDLQRSFTLDDPPAEMAHFLSQAGFLEVRDVFDPAEMAALSDEIDVWRDRMTPGDPRAWYATVDGEQVCVRVTKLGRAVDFGFVESLAPIAAITADGRSYTGSDLLVKPVGVTEGISDLPWHKDCALGMHSYRCRSLTCGISVTASGPDNGQLGVVAGSHRVNIPLMDVAREIDLPVMYLSTEPGDVTVHLSCTMHCATPPQHSERRVVYSDFALARETAELDEKINRVRDQAGRETYAPT